MSNYFMETHHHEWILTNRRGGYALGTGNLINQRKYHGLLVSSDSKFNRFHLVAGIEEKVEWQEEFFTWIVIITAIAYIPRAFCI